MKQSKFLVLGFVVFVAAFLLMPSRVNAAPALCFRDSGSGYEEEPCPQSLNAQDDNCYSSTRQGNYTEVSCTTLAAAACADEQTSDSCSTITTSLCEKGPGLFGFPTWYQYLDAEFDSSGRCQPVLNGTSSILPIGVAILDIMLRLAGILAAVFVIVGGVKYIISQGDPDRAKSARNTIINALIGLAITIVSTPIVRFIGSRFGES